MRFHIDRFMRMGGSFIIHGWADCFQPGDDLIIAAGGLALVTVTKPLHRPDLPAVFGDGSERWGFRAFGIEDPRRIVSAKSVSLTFADGTVIGDVSIASVPMEDRSAEAAWQRFVAHANEAGGTLIEIGSRARSGNTRRDQFGNTIRYIGVDVSTGPNVDIVADAHTLSDVVEPNVDYVCSVSTFEHFIMPWKVVLEINKILKVGGRVYTQSHQAWPEHDAPFDYFRFSEQAWSGLFNAHTGFRIVETQMAHAVSITAQYNQGGPFEDMDSHSGQAMSTCVAEKIAAPMVAWDAPPALVYDAAYTY